MRFDKLSLKQKRSYYKEKRNQEMVSELISFLVEGDSIGEACDKTMEIFPRDIFVDVAGVVEVYD